MYQKYMQVNIYLLFLQVLKNADNKKVISKIKRFGNRYLKLIMIEKHRNKIKMIDFSF